MTITKERLLKIQHWRETYGADSNVMLPAEEAEELARIALAALNDEPVAYNQVQRDMMKDIIVRKLGGNLLGHKLMMADIHAVTMALIQAGFRTAQPASERERIRHEHAEWSYADPVVFTDERNLRHIASGRETSLIWGKQNQEVGDIPLYRHAQPVPVDKEFIPKNLDKALGVVGVALPESKEEFNFQTERWIQRLIDRVIRYADEFKEQPVPVVPDDISGIIERFQYQADHLSEWHHIDEHSCKVNRRDLMTALEFMDSCRAAMLNGGKS
ncbi:Eaa protein [Salmonella enterica subsp. enterica]|nr:Eaa protein [Salmonella enterica subsp. enterica]